MTTTELSKKHNRKEFDCGTPVLNEYLSNSARQHASRGISRTYVLTSESSTADIIGFHTLTLSEVYAPKGSQLYKKYPHKLPVLKIARLAVDVKHQGRGVGGFLLSDVMSKAIQAHEVAPILGIVVDAKDKKAKEFYLPYGFIEAGGDEDELYLFIPMSVIKEAMQN